MPEAVLAGPNGGPAIDQITGQPLTMEEMLRRRGILAYKGVASPLNVAVDPATSAANAVDSATADAAAATAATAANSTGSTAAIGASPDAVGPDGMPLNATPATPVAANDVQATVPPDDGSGGDSDWLKWLLGGTAAGLAAYGASKLRKGATVDTPGEASAAGRTMGERVTRNPNLYREGVTIDGVANEVKGSNRRLSPNIDGKNVTHAGEVGAGPKALSGAAPVTDVSNDSLQSALAGRMSEKPLPDFHEPGAQPPLSRMQQGARQATSSRVQPSNSSVIHGVDEFTDLSPDEMTVANEIAKRLKIDRIQGLDKAPRRIGTTNTHKQAVIGQNFNRRPVLGVDAEDAKTLQDAVMYVRSLKQQGYDMTKVLPRMRAIIR